VSIIPCNTSATSTPEEKRMRTVDDGGMWVVYLMTVHKHPQPMNAVCSQDEWDAMERTRPGHHLLV
jgi:hypothetical protein